MVSTVDNGAPPRPGEDPDFARIAQSPAFVALRRRVLRFVLPMAAAFVIWYAVYVGLALYAPKFMAIKVAGDFTVGFVLGVLQFLSTFGLTALYVRYAGTRVDPAAAELRRAVEAGQL